MTLNPWPAAMLTIIGVLTIHLVPGLAMVAGVILLAVVPTYLGLSTLVNTADDRRVK